jgi:hypothetical protein
VYYLQIYLFFFFFFFFVLITNYLTCRPFTRRAWLRKLNAAALLASASIGLSAVTIAPVVLDLMGPVPLVISFAMAYVMD